MRSRLAPAFFAAVALSFYPFFARAEEVELPKNITFDDLKFEHKPDQPFKRELLGAKIEALNGKTVKIRGYMLVTFQRKVKNFVIVAKNDYMRFGPDSISLGESIIVEMSAGETAEFTANRISVEGRFSIREFEVDGKVRAVYHIQATQVAAVVVKGK